MFSVSKKDVMPYEVANNIHINVTFEMSFSLVKYFRTVYTYFDLLSDVGGLTGMFFSIFAIIVSFWTYNSFDNLMVSKLFKMKRESVENADGSEKSRKFTDSSYLKMSHFPFCKELIIAWTPGCFVCCKLTR